MPAEYAIVQEMLKGCLQAKKIDTQEGFRYTRRSKKAGNIIYIGEYKILSLIHFLKFFKS